MGVLAMVINPGDKIMRGRQRYEAVGVREYTRKDGTPSALVVWRTTCPTCTAPFEVLGPVNPRSLNKRCDLHKAPGRKVTKEEGVRK